MVYNSFSRVGVGRKVSSEKNLLIHVEVNTLWIGVTEVPGVH